MANPTVEKQVEKRNIVLDALFGVSDARGLVRILPGFLLAVALMLIAIPITDKLGAWLLSLQGIDPTGKKSPISAVLTAIVLGILVRNLIPLPKIVEDGIKFSTTKILRLGIILVGIKLSILDVFKLGAWGIPVVVSAIFGGLWFISWINRKLNLPERLGTLIAAGTGICGVTAIVSTAPAIKADQKEVAYAVANITLFGLLGMFLYPYLAPYILHTSEQIGLFLGTAVHETSQVIGAALTYKEVFNDETVLKAATVTKLTRNLFLAVVVPLLAYLYLRRMAAQGEGDGTKVSIVKLLPAFVLGFIAMAIFRSIGDAQLAAGGMAFGTWDKDAWKAFTDAVGEFWGSRALGTAMAAVGLATTFSVFKGVGLKPFLVGFIGALVVGVIGWVMALLLGGYVKL
ncbi:MAG: putative sulfate exporter family transporter [Armatimonadota bacterium]|nr:putative sulfate exporter family transporter [Armatimonadota bacterium]MDW8052783.1 putative sulfate exporter family transporter [Armatimonadota bacterium]